MTQAQLKLGAFLIGSGHHVAAWRHPDAPSPSQLFETYRRAALTAEKAFFDAIFFADSSVARCRTQCFAGLGQRANG